MDATICEYCGGPKSIRNPTGGCDHLYWPDNVRKEAAMAEEAIGPMAQEIIAHHKDRVAALTADNVRLRQALYKIANDRAAIIAADVGTTGECKRDFGLEWIQRVEKIALDAVSS